MSPTVADLITRETLWRLAGGRSFERGEEYAEIGAVGGLRWDEVSVRAAVQGHDRYRVRLEASGETLTGSCSCPVGRDGVFCKHCVAVGLAWLTRAAGGKEEPSPPTRSELRDRLAALGAERLAELLVDHALDDERLHARLLTLTAVPASGSATADVARLAHAFDIAVDPGGLVTWQEAHGFAEALEEVVEAAEEQLGSGQGAEIIAFSEHALRRVEQAFEYVDDSDGSLGEVKERLENLHLAACRHARPDPVELAERLFSWEMTGDWETFAGAVTRYAEVLGPRGIARYRELAEAAWVSEPELGPGDHFSWSSRRFRLSRIMEDLARSEGDIDGLVTILARDRSSPHRYLLIAEALLEAGRADEAIDWAERGLAAFAERPDSRLLDFLCERYGEAASHEEALRLAWTTLEASANLEGYQRLARVASRASVWDEWRGRARDLLRRGPEAVGRGRDRSELVAALLWEGEIDAGWREAKEGGCRRELWLSLARRRERDHPADALEIYQTQIEPAIRHGDNHTYRAAIEWLEKVEALSARLGREQWFAQLVDEIRERHRPKRNLIKRLDERGWAQPAGARSSGARPATKAVHS